MEFIQDISKWLVIGLVLAALISALIPNEFFELINLPSIVQMLLILVVSIPLYICATGSIPLAAVLILKGISPGAAFVLLMAGPATNAATITMIGKVLGKRSLIVYLLTIIVGAMGTGLLIDYLLPAHWFIDIAQQHLGHHHEALSWWQLASAIVLSMLIVNGYIQERRKTTKEKMKDLSSGGVDSKLIGDEGMTCTHCKTNVESSLEALPFVESATVNLAEKTVRIEGEQLELGKIRDTIDGLGYKVSF